MEGIQLVLPAGWARRATLEDPADQLDRLRQDVLDAKAELREVLDRLADRHGIKPLVVTEIVEGYVDAALGDLVYALEEELRDEIDRDRPG